MVKGIWVKHTCVFYCIHVISNLFKNQYVTRISKALPAFSPSSSLTPKITTILASNTIDWLHLFHTLYKRNYTACPLLFLVSFIHYFKIHHAVACINSSSFTAILYLLYMSISNVFICFTHWRTFRLFVVFGHCE